MKIGKVLVFLAFLGILITGLVLLIDYGSDSTYVVYSGDITFDTEWEYTSFKEYLMVSEVVIKDIEYFESNPLVWIRYSVEVPRHWKFPFAYDYMAASTSSVSKCRVAVIAIGLIGLLGSAAWIINEDEN